MGAATLVLALLAGPLAGAAAAHADVTGVSPAPAAVLERSPKSVKVFFSEGVDVGLGGVFVYDANGDRVPTGSLRQPVPERLVLPITGDLADGSYIVTYRAVSEDTHPIQGTWTFVVGSASASVNTTERVAAGLLAGQRADRSVAIGWGIARWVVFVSIALLVGGVAFGAVIWPRSRDARVTRRIVTTAWIGLTVATAVGAMLFGAYSRGGSLGDALDPGILRDTLDTRFGKVWLARLVLLGVAFVVLRVLFARRPAATSRLPQWWLPVAAIVGVGLVGSPGLAGHASTGDHRALALLTDGLHVAAMSVWLGGLMILGAAVLSHDDTDEIRIASRRFSRVAFWSVVVLVVTGAFQTWRIVGGLDALRDDDYGRILVVKLVVVAVMLVVASFSREITGRLFPAPATTDAPVVRGGAIDLDPAPDPGPGIGTGSDDADTRTRELRSLRRSVWCEIALGALVLVVTALLVNAAPPAEGAARREGATGVTIENPKLTLDVTATPGAAGLNDLHVNTYSPEGTPLAVDAVELTLALDARNLAPLEVPLRQLGPGHYLSPGLDVPIAGTWTIQAIVRLGPVDRVDLTGALEIR
ncbi:MAG: copper resistance CopC/CopD family protein [Actinomycetota bacterium]